MILNLLQFDRFFLSKQSYKFSDDHNLFSCDKKVSDVVLAYEEYRGQNNSSADIFFDLNVKITEYSTHWALSVQTKIKKKKRKFRLRFK